MKQEDLDNVYLELLEWNFVRLMILVDELFDAFKVGKGIFWFYFILGNFGNFIEIVVYSFSSEVQVRNMIFCMIDEIFGVICLFFYNVLE